MEAAVAIALITTLGGVVVAWLENRNRKRKLNEEVIGEIRKIGAENTRDHAEVQQSLAEVNARLLALRTWTEQHDARHVDLNERLESMT